VHAFIYILLLFAGENVVDKALLDYIMSKEYNQLRKHVCVYKYAYVYAYKYICVHVFTYIKLLFAAEKEVDKAFLDDIMSKEYN
jgi:hypothetical protein